MVMNTPGGNTVSTAQLALSLLCSMARNIPAADMSVKEVGGSTFCYSTVVTPCTDNTYNLYMLYDGCGGFGGGDAFMGG